MLLVITFTEGCDIRVYTVGVEKIIVTLRVVDPRVDVQDEHSSDKNNGYVSAIIVNMRETHCPKL